ncbi:MAG: hypothetical protein NUV46_04455 [Nanoarchaeota archaeon]|nr:hypothetical protein [Nanoarchaeota archaeon]
MKKTNKKGSHISLVLSFIIFVVSLMFVYLIASASITNVDSKRGTLLIIEKNLIKEVSQDLWVSRVNANDSASCIKLTIPNDVIVEGGKSAAVGDNGSVNSKVPGANPNNVFVEGGGFVKVYYSNFFEDDTFESEECENLPGDSWSKENTIVEPKIQELFLNFSNNYSILKEKLGISDSSEFNLYFEYSNGSSFGDYGVDFGVNIYSREVDIEYLSIDSGYKNGKLMLKVW